MNPLVTLPVVFLETKNTEKYAISLMVPLGLFLDLFKTGKLGQNYTEMASNHIIVPSGKSWSWLETVDDIRIIDDSLVEVIEDLGVNSGVKKQLAVVIIMLSASKA